MKTDDHLPLIALSLRDLRVCCRISVGVPPPGAEVIDLVSSEDEDAQDPAPAPATTQPPALLAPDLTRRGGLYIAPSRVPIETGPAAGSTLQEPGLFTSVALPAAAFVCIYTVFSSQMWTLTACRPHGAVPSPDTQSRWGSTASPSRHQSMR